MSRSRDVAVQPLSDDDPVEIRLLPNRNPSNLENLLNPRPSSRPSLPNLRQSRSSQTSGRPAPPAPFRPVLPRQQQQQQSGTQFIDLTEEPDSPGEQRVPPPVGRNPRRTSSLRRSTPPRLSRSDGFFMNPPHGVIDLTVDSPEDELLPGAGPRSRGHRPHPPPPMHHHFPRHLIPADQLIHLEFVNRHQHRLASDLARGLGRRLAGFLESEIIRSGGFSPPQFDAARSSYGSREESPKPPMEPLPPTRPGYTRDTCTEAEKLEESITICPACNDELAYNPAGSGQTETTTKKRKRAPGEHHFWALKKCGHVRGLMTWDVFLFSFNY